VASPATGDELALSKERVVHRPLSIQVKIAILAAATILIYFQDLYITGSEALASDYYNYVLVIPVLAGYLIYRKRRVLAAVLPVRDDAATGGYQNLAAGISALAVSVIMYLYGSVTSSPENFHLISLEIFLAAAVLLLFNRQTLRILLVPIFLVTAALPAAISFGLSYWIYMSWLSAIPAFEFFKIIGLHATLGTSTVGPAITISSASGSAYTFVVGVASSGIYSVVGATLFFAFVGYIAKGALWKKIALFVVAYPLLILVNVAREIVIISAAYEWGLAAFNVFHETSGIVLIFILVFLMLVLGQRAFNLEIFPTRSLLKYCSLCKDQLKARQTFCVSCGRFLGDTVAKFTNRDSLSILAIALIVILFSSSLIPKVSVASAPTNTALDSINSQNALTFLPTIPGWSLTYIGQDSYSRNALEADAYMLFTYASENASAPTQVTAVVQISAQTHTPETSLQFHPLNFGLQTAQFYVQPEDVQLLDQPSIVGQYMVCLGAECGPYPFALMYWQEPALFNIGGYYDTRTIQVQLRQFTTNFVAEGVLRNASDYQGAERLLMPLAEATAKYWAPQGATSYLTLGVKKWGLPAIGLAIFPAALFIGIETMRNSSSLRRKWWFLAKSQEKLTTNVGSLGEQSSAVLGFLRKKMMAESKSANDLDRKIITVGEIIGVGQFTESDVVTALTYAEHLGVAKKLIVDDNNEPVQKWAVDFRKVDRITDGN
jgi:exosortase/archaeosortase family protein